MKADAPALLRLVVWPLLMTHVECFCVEMQPAVLLVMVKGAWDCYTEQNSNVFGWR